MAQRSRRSKAKRGGDRPGSGRPPLFEGKRVRLDITITEDARAVVDGRRAALTAKYGEKLATDSSAVEHLIRYGGDADADVPMDDDEEM